MTQSSDRPSGDELAEQEQIAKDVSYSPSSGRETEERQESPRRSAATEDVDADAVETLPGTGGPDDPGAVDVAPDDLDVPRDAGSH